MHRALISTVLGVAAGLSGCSVLRVELDVPIDRPAGGYPVGDTHYRTVVDELGPPTTVSAFNDGVAFLYEHMVIRERQLGISVDSEWFGQGYEFLDWVKFAYGKSYADREALLLVFDAAGYLQTERLVAWRDDIGTGFSIQLIVEVSSVVDSSSMHEGGDVSEWGGALLRTPPEVLNTRQSLDLGQVGVELSGAPDRVGQHTLEMRADER